MIVPLSKIMLQDPWLREHVVCPRDENPLEVGADQLVCSSGHRYRIVDGIPVLLRDDVEHVHWAANRALELSEKELVEGSGHIEGTRVHSFVQQAIGATNGHMYGALRGKLEEYPIPTLRAEPYGGSLFLDIGCNWGRWCLAASRAGFDAIGIDPSFEAVHAARAVARQLGIDARFLVADARDLPFRRASFDFAFSYSVLQHLPRDQVRMSVAAIKRVLKSDGRAMVQMPNRLGLRSLYHQARRGFREAKAFEVRYWSVTSLEEMFSELIGPSKTIVDGFWSLNAQASDYALLPLRYRAVIFVSESLRGLSKRFEGLKYVADSIYVCATAE